jgi:hypothetical protein
MWIATGASENHARSLLQFLHSIPVQNRTQVYMWDLGLSKQTLETIQTQFPTVRLRRFPFEDYPPYFDIQRNAGEYAWKPVLLWRTAQEIQEGVLLWCDAGNRFVGPLEPLRTTIQSQGIYSPISSGTIEKWTHPQCLAYLEVEREMLGMPPRNGAIVGFDLSQGQAWNILEEWSQLAQIQHCIAPPGSNRSNHRQDQAVFSILYYRYTHGTMLENNYVSLQIHQDCD